MHLLCRISSRTEGYYIYYTINRERTVAFRENFQRMDASLMANGNREGVWRSTLGRSMKACGIFSSYSGNTRCIAEGDRDACDCDLIGKRGHTAPSLPRPGSSGPGDGLRPDRARGDRSHGRYDFVIIGSPVWAGRATPAINRRCSAHRMRRGRTIRMIRGTFNDEKMFTSAIAETRERRWAHRRPDRLRIWLMILGSRLIVIAGGEPLGRLEEILSSAGVHLRILLTVFANRLLIDARGRDRAAPEQSQLRELRRGDRQAPGDRGQRPSPSNLRKVEGPEHLLPARSDNPGKSPTRCLSADPGKSGARVPVVRAVPGEPGGPDGERGKVRRRR